MPVGKGKERKGKGILIKERNWKGKERSVDLSLKKNELQTFITAYFSLSNLEAIRC